MTDPRPDLDEILCERHRQHAWSVVHGNDYGTTEAADLALVNAITKALARVDVSARADERAKTIEECAKVCEDAMAVFDKAVGTELAAGNPYQARIFNAQSEGAAENADAIRALAPTHLHALGVNDTEET